MPLPTGAYAPVPTPLDSRGAFDPRALRHHLRWLSAQGLEGALILGTNGEFPSFSLAERRSVAEAAAAASSGLELMLGVGSCALPECLEMAVLGGELGFGAVLAPPPFYFRGAPVDGMAAFFVELLEGSPLPVLLYHIPQVSGVAVSDDLLEAIGHLPRLAGTKDSSEEPAELDRLCSRFRDRCYMVGSDRLVTACLKAGGSGSISAAASVAPALVGRVQRGEAEQRRLDVVRGLLERFGLGPAVKAILRRAGLGDYATRPPLQELDEVRSRELWEAYCELVPESERPRR
jgi:4-hydroxy-tetrahydrodipicolinate synthase